MPPPGPIYHHPVFVILTSFCGFDETSSPVNSQKLELYEKLENSGRGTDRGTSGQKSVTSLLRMLHKMLQSSSWLIVSDLYDIQGAI